MASIGFPVFSIVADPDNPAIVYVAGGGGKSRTGVSNAILAFELVDRLWELKGEGCWMPETLGAPMNLAVVNKNYLVCGIDEYSHIVKRSAKNGLELKEKFRTDFKVPKNIYDESYQKVVVSTLDGSLLCSGGTDSVVRLWDTRDIGSYFSPPEANIELVEHKSEIDDVAFSASSDLLATVSSDFLCIWRLAIDKKVVARLVTKLDTKLLDRKDDYRFRLACFGRGPTADFLFTISLDSRRRSYLSKWRISDWKLIQNRRINPKPVSCMAMSHNGQNIALGSSEGGVACVSTVSLLIKWLESGAHGFTVTAVYFDARDTFLFSGSADQSCKVWHVLRKEIIMTGSFMITVLVVLLAVYIAVFGVPDVLVQYQALALHKIQEFMRP